MFKYHILFYDGMYINYIIFFIYNSVSSYACILILQIEEVRCCYDTLLIYIFVYLIYFFSKLLYIISVPFLNNDEKNILACE
jgi:hypothetical protein